LKRFNVRRSESLPPRIAGSCTARFRLEVGSVARRAEASRTLGPQRTQAHPLFSHPATILKRVTKSGPPSWPESPGRRRPRCLHWPRADPGPQGRRRPPGHRSCLLRVLQRGRSITASAGNAESPCDRADPAQGPPGVPTFGPGTRKDRPVLLANRSLASEGRHDQSSVRLAPPGLRGRGPAVPGRRHVGPPPKEETREGHRDR
jgi:hypothetical protein